jgi:hypothetical protein
MDDTSWNWGYNLSLKANGTWTFDAETDFDPGTYDLTVSMRAEGKLFENAASFTIEDKETSGRYTYNIAIFGPKKTAHIFEDDTEIYVGNSSFSMTTAQLLNEAYLGLKDSYPELTKDGGPDWSEAT